MQENEIRSCSCYLIHTSIYLRAGRMFVELDLSLNCVGKVMELSFIDLLNYGIVFISQIIYFWLVCTRMYNSKSNKKKSKDSSRLTTDHIPAKIMMNLKKLLTTHPWSYNCHISPTDKWLHFRHLATGLCLWPVAASCSHVTMLPFSSCHFPAKDTHWTS